MPHAQDQPAHHTPTNPISMHTKTCTLKGNQDHQKAGTKNRMSTLGRLRDLKRQGTLEDVDGISNHTAIFRFLVLQHLPAVPTAQR